MQTIRTEAKEGQLCGISVKREDLNGPELQELKMEGIVKKTLLYGLLAAGVLVVAFRPREAAGLERPVLVAHRGANRLADENTLKAYALAADYGMDYFECDPRLTTDGVFVLMHDARVDRTTTGTGAVEDMTLKQIKYLKTKHGEEIPTLDEAFDLAEERNIKVYLDTKLHEIPEIEKLAARIVSAGMSEKVVMGLWTKESQVWMEKNHPGIATSVAFPLAAAGPKQAREIGAEWIGMIVPQATPGMIKNCHKHGLKVVTLPINKEPAIEEKIRSGISVLQTDDAAMLKSVVDRMFR